MTQEYTPTDEVIKDAACFPKPTRLGEPYPIDPSDYDRWLAAHDAQIRAEASSEALELVTSRELNVGVNAAYKDDLLTHASSALQKAMRAIAQYRKEQQ